MVTPESLYQLRLQAKDQNYTLWVTQELFSTRWWGQLIFMVLSYIICFTLIDKRRFREILLFGSLVAVLTTVYDVFGSSLLLWSFFGRFFPFIPSIFLLDLTVVPLYFMLVYQYTNTWLKFLIWIMIASAIMSFVLLPILSVLKIYKIYNWRNIYTFIVLSAIGIACRFTEMKFKKIEDLRKD